MGNEWIGKRENYYSNHAQKNHGLTQNPSDTSTAISVPKWSFRRCHSKLYFFSGFFFFQNSMTDESK